MANNPNQVIGRAKVRIDGALIDTGENSVKLTPGGVTNEAMKGDYSIAIKRGPMEPANLEFDALTKRNFDAIAFGNLADVTVSIDFDNGQSFTMRHAAAAATPMIGTDGKAACVLIGPPADRTS
ncbi:MAG: phage tail tube protein [Sphingomonas sp.]